MKVLHYAEDKHVKKSSSVLTAAERFHLGENRAGEKRFRKNLFDDSRAVALGQLPPPLPPHSGKKKPQGWGRRDTR